MTTKRQASNRRDHQSMTIFLFAFLNRPQPYGITYSVVLLVLNIHKKNALIKEI